MSKKSFFIILVLSVVIGEVVSIIDAFRRSSFLAGQVGFPLRYSSSSLFGGGSINYIMLILDIVFWFAVIWGLWKLLAKILKR